MVDGIHRKLEKSITDYQNQTPEERQRDLEAALAKFTTEFVNSQKALDPDDAKILEENLWNCV